MFIISISQCELYIYIYIIYLAFTFLYLEYLIFIFIVLTAFITYTSTKCTHKSFPVFLRDHLTKQYIEYEFETTSVSSPEITLQTHKS